MNYCRQSPPFEYRHYIYPKVIDEIVRPVITSEQIINLVCQEFDVTPLELKNQCRKQTFLFPRKVAAKLMLRFTEMSLKRIGMFFNQDHATVIHTRDNFEKLFGKHPDLKRKYFLLVDVLNKLN